MAHYSLRDFASGEAHCQKFVQMYVNNQVVTLNDLTHGPLMRRPAAQQGGICQSCYALQVQTTPSDGKYCLGPLN